MATNDKTNSNDTKVNNSNAKDGGVVQYQFAQKPVERPGWEGFKMFIWNSETNEFLGRTGCSWFKITVFYLIYYTFLTGYFIAMLLIFYQTLDDFEPKWQNANGIIGENPGLGFRPSPEKIESTMIWYRHGDYEATWDDWVERLETHLKPYHNLLNETKPDGSVIECSFERGAGESQICKVNANEMFDGECSKENNYGYRDGKPCVLIKLNKIFGWLPKPYQNSSELPKDAPKSLRDYMVSKDKDPMMGKTIWLSCEGENPADVENIGEIDFYPYPGIPTYYFPYKNQIGYLSPAIFAHFKNPKQGVLISISCKAWGHDIVHDTMDRKGSVHFELMID